MRLPSSSTFSSRKKCGQRRRAALATLGWTLLALIVLDLACGILFPMPADPRQAPGTLAQYFNYGLSIEGKLGQMLQPTDARSSPIVHAGWIETECQPTAQSLTPGQTGISIYGMSFSGNVAAQLRAIDPALSIESYGGPGAGPNHSYACFKQVSASGKDPNQIQIIGILASSVRRMLTLGGLTTSFEGPQPFTYPRYHLKDGRPVTTIPVVRSSADLRDPDKLAAYFAQLARHDAYYDPFLVRGNVTDHSIIFRLIRRAYAQAHYRRVDAELVNDGNDFVDNPQIGPVLHAMLRDFSETARSQGKMPMVILFQDRNFGTDSLYRLLKPALDQDGIAFVRSDLIAPATDPRNFIPDGHFTPAMDRKIAQAVHAEIRRFSAAR